MFTFTSDEDAYKKCVQLNRKAKDRGAHEFWVIVEGPEDYEITVMPIEDAIEGGFVYEWYV